MMMIMNDDRQADTTLTTQTPSRDELTSLRRQVKELSKRVDNIPPSKVVNNIQNNIHINGLGERGHRARHRRHLASSSGTLATRRRRTKHPRDSFPRGREQKRPTRGRRRERARARLFRQRTTRLRKSNHERVVCDDKRNESF